MRIELAIRRYMQREVDLRSGAALAGVSYNRFRGPLRVLDQRVQRKREIFAFYRHALADRHHAPPAPNFGGEGCVSPRIGG